MRRLPIRNARSDHWSALAADPDPPVLGIVGSPEAAIQPGTNLLQCGRGGGHGQVRKANPGRRGYCHFWWRTGGRMIAKSARLPECACGRLLELGGRRARPSFCIPRARSVANCGIKSLLPRNAGGSHSLSWAVLRPVRWFRRLPWRRHRRRFQLADSASVSVSLGPAEHARRGVRRTARQHVQFLRRILESRSGYGRSGKSRHDRRSIIMTQPTRRRSAH
jgi:hypothetical protein